MSTGERIQSLVRFRTVKCWNRTLCGRLVKPSVLLRAVDRLTEVHLFASRKGQALNRHVALSSQQMVIILESERLLFRPHEPADLDSFCAMEMDPEFRRYVGGHARSREDAERKFPRDQLRKVTDRLAVWAAVLKSNGQYVGRSGLYPHLDRGDATVLGEAALSFYFGREHWGQGLASEAGAAFVKFGWEELQLSRIVATVQVENGASVHILEKLGFELIAAEPGAYRSFLKFALANPSSLKR
jgi:[ribosomal protein S5]-alanine N-acetyltransferase